MIHPSFRASALAAPCLAARFKAFLGAVSHALIACSLFAACTAQDDQVAAPQRPSLEEGPGSAVPGPAAVAVSEAEYAALAKAASTNCTVAFNDPWGLALLPDMARNTFALPNWYSHDCPGDGAARVLENPSSRYGEAWGSDYGHYHLGYQRGNFCLTPDDFEEGIMTNGTCVKVAHPEQEDRILGSHTPDHWIRLYAFGPAPLGRPSPELTFDFKGIKVNAGSKIRIYARKATGNWVTWGPLNNARWNIGGGEAVREVLISAATGEVGPFFIDDLVIALP